MSDIDVHRDESAETEVTLTRVGDYMQSEASRLAEFVADLPADYPIPYEVRQALFGVTRAVRQWTDIRRGKYR